MQTQAPRWVRFIGPIHHQQSLWSQVMVVVGEGTEHPLGQTLESQVCGQL